MFKNCRKEDLRIVALELGETLSEKVTIVELTEIIKENKYFKEDVEFVKELIQYTSKTVKKAEEARLREKELELELARLHRVNSDNERTDEGYNSLDALVKSVRILTVKVPNRPEEQKTVNRDMVVQTVKSDIITPYITQSERETRKFIHNCRSKVKRRGPLTTNEVNESETWLIKQDQSGINLSDPSGLYNRFALSHTLRQREMSLREAVNIHGMSLIRPLRQLGSRYCDDRENFPPLVTLQFRDDSCPLIRKVNYPK
ncbi:hypothetical protein TNCT_358141 [Trichonephila clavata]|uniref:Uncharacterized protein n=1 Tax=Trichonephila clavata TaxID=2740835 RepID=A0A8X6KU15_TRICU|nr:hypothetical protein TNCT_358141 [Trichonephila clavata]